MVVVQPVALIESDCCSCFQMDLIEIKKNLCFDSVVVQAQAYGLLLKRVNWSQIKVSLFLSFELTDPDIVI